MTVAAETRYEVKADEALRNASADQLRRAMRFKLVEASHFDEEVGAYVNPDDDSKVEDIEAFSEAAARWRRGDKREALHHLELALGRDFIGLGDLRPEDLR